MHGTCNPKTFLSAPRIQGAVRGAVKVNPTLTCGNYRFGPTVRVGGDRLVTSRVRCNSNEDPRTKMLDGSMAKVVVLAAAFLHPPPSLRPGPMAAVSHLPHLSSSKVRLWRPSSLRQGTVVRMTDLGDTPSWEELFDRSTLSFASFLRARRPRVAYT